MEGNKAIFKLRFLRKGAGGRKGAPVWGCAGVVVPAIKSGLICFLTNSRFKNRIIFDNSGFTIAIGRCILAEKPLMNDEFTEVILSAHARALPVPCMGRRGAQVAMTSRKLLAMAAFFAAMATMVSANPVFTASVGTNTGDPLFCQPNEGVVFLIVNGGAGVFTADPDCYNNNINNDVTTSITTGQSGNLALTRTPTAGNYVYTPPTPTFTGLDTFSIPVTTVFNSAGGTGSAGGSTRPGGPATLAITLNVIPSTLTLTANGAPITVPVPAGSVTGCTVGGNSGTGPAPGAVYGCITGVIASGTAPSHGTLSISGNTIKYTPTNGYSGPDTFQYQAVGVNADGPNALNSGLVTVQVVDIAAAVIGVPTLGVWGMALLCGLLLLFGVKALSRRTA